MEKLEITVGTHFFQVRPGNSEKYKALCMSFTRKYIKVDVQGQTKTVTVFAAANQARTWFRFHINAFKDFDMHLVYNGIKREDVIMLYLPEPTVEKADIKVLPKWTPMDYQLPILDYLTKPVGKKDDATGQWVDGGPRSRLVGIQTGKGKGQPFSAKIKIPGGWTTMGEIQVNDVITAKDGSPCIVEAIHPQGFKPVYKVTFADGRSTRVDDTHLWKVNSTEFSSGSEFVLLDTMAVKALVEKGDQVISVPLCNSEQIVEVDLPFDPYLLGSLLSSKGVFGSGAASFKTADADVYQRFKTALPKGCTLGEKAEVAAGEMMTANISHDKRKAPYDEVQAGLKMLGLDRTNCYSRFIPEEYLNACSVQRVFLFHALMDSDGRVTDEGNIVFTTVSKQLAGNMQYLVRSLGGIAKLEVKGGERVGAPVYEIEIRIPHPYSAFSCKRLSNAAKEKVQVVKDLKLAIKSIEYDKDEPTQCISVKHAERLYVTDDFIVTHNTFCALKAISDLGYKFVVIVLAQFVTKWAGGIDPETKKYVEGDIEKVLDIKPKEILKVQGGKAMQALTQMALTEGSMDDFKAIVISNRTYENYLRCYENYGTEMDTMGYLVSPDELWQKLGIGIRLVDEVHMHFHANFRLDLYTHVMRSISLSATLKSSDQAMVRIYQVAYPPQERFHEGPVDKYADSFGVIYGVPDNWSYKTTHRGTSNYNHTAYEASILKNKEFTKAYGDMFAEYIKMGYKANYKPGNKFILFAASIEMCTKLTEILSKKFPEYNIKRYVSGDSYETNYQQPDGRVTTIGSGGTGHDIKGLTDNHMGTAIDSIQANIQAFGRLRKIDDQQTRFYFYSCENIQKHMGYHSKKKELMRERAKSYTPLYHGTIGANNWCI